MTNLGNGLAIDDWDVVKEVEKIKPIKDSLHKIVAKSGNPHLQLWRDYIGNKIKVDELHRVLRGKLLKSIHKMRRQQYPSEPTIKTPSNVNGWAIACNKVECVNAGNKFWLGILLTDIIEGKLEAEQGKEEEIEELLRGWYAKEQKKKIYKGV